MCLAIPAKIIEIDQQMATVEVGGVTRRASVILLPDAGLGDFVLIHAGFAISLVDEREAHETIKMFEALASEIDNQGDPGRPAPENETGESGSSHMDT